MRIRGGTGGLAAPLLTNFRPARALATFALCSVFFATSKPSFAAPTHERNDYADRAFSSALASGLKNFYARDFKSAEADFQKSLTIVPDNTFAISFLNAAAAQQDGELDVLTNREEDALTDAPKNYLDHVRLGFTYLFDSAIGRDRTQDAREEFNAAVALDASAAPAHIGLGIMRFDDRSANRAKVEFLAALHANANDVLAREYLGQLYQTDLRDPAVGLRYVIDVPNLVPGYADIQFHIGSILSDLGQPATALAYLQRGVALDSGHVGEAGQHGYTLIARIYIDQNKLPDAEKELDLAIADDVDAIYAKTLLAKIKNGDYHVEASPAPYGGASAPPRQ